METVQFYNGRTMPKIGLGTYRVKDGDECRESVNMLSNGVIEV